MRTQHQVIEMSAPLSIIPEPHTDYPKTPVALSNHIADLSDDAIEDKLISNGFEPWMTSQWSRKDKIQALYVAILTDRKEWQHDFGRYIEK